MRHGSKCININLFLQLLPVPERRIQGQTSLFSSSHAIQTYQRDAAASRTMVQQYLWCIQSS